MSHSGKIQTWEHEDKQRLKQSPAAVCDRQGQRHVILEGLFAFEWTQPSVASQLYIPLVSPAEIPDLFPLDLTDQSRSRDELHRASWSSQGLGWAKSRQLNPELRA